MSKQHKGEYSEAEIEDLYTRYSNERVRAMVEEAKAVSEAEAQELLGDADDSSEDQGPDYESKTVAELTELLDERGLPKSGNKAELVERLQEDDANKASEADSDA